MVLGVLVRRSLRLTTVRRRVGRSSRSACTRRLVTRRLGGCGTKRQSKDASPKD
jgi:hypothetical protein